MPKPLQSAPTGTIIPYGKQTIGAEELDAVSQVLHSDFFTQGPTIPAFEQAVADYCNVPYAVAFSSGTAALHAACAILNLKPDDEVITSPITFVASSNAVVYQQARPVFADIHPQTWNIDTTKLQYALTPQTKALLPVHFAGEPVDLDTIYTLADKHNLPVIEDACHALGARFQNKPIGQCRDMAVFSFHPVKSITTGEGGMVVTPHRQYYDKLLMFRTHGITKSTEQFTSLAGEPWEYEMQTLGFNYRLTDIQAAMGLAQLPKLDEFIAKRTQIAQHYRDAFKNDPRVQFQQLNPQSQSAHHLCVIRINPQHTTVTRRALYDGLKAANIHTQVHYIPVHMQPYYQQQFGYRPGQFPHAEAYYAHCLSLPIYPNLTDADQTRVIQALKQVLG